VHVTSMAFLASLVSVVEFLTLREKISCSVCCPCVLFPFVSDAPTSSLDPTPPGAPEGGVGVSRAGRLLALVRKLIDYGRELAARLQRDPAMRPYGFGSADRAMILAQITRGLHRGQALEERLVRTAARLDAPSRPRRAGSQRRPRAAKAAAPREHDNDPRLACLPTPEQIAADVRRRPIGAVLADICRDLGIQPCHPLWRELHELIVREGGNFTSLLKDIIHQAGRAVAQAWINAGLPPGPLSPSPPSAGARPP
jgi:hypothetical protein